MLTRVETFGAATLYLGDAREIVPSLPRPAALIGDPPYGQKHKTNVTNRRAQVRDGKLYPASDDGRYPRLIAGDDVPFDPSPWLGAALITLLWGAHKFNDRLPPGQFLIWDKVPTGKRRCQGDGEAAWLNSTRPMRVYRLLWDGFCVGPGAKRDVNGNTGLKRVHPTQKPVAVMAWCIAEARVPAGGLILDPWMGAGSTGIAAVEAGHPFVGIEIEPQYFDVACRRIEAAANAVQAKAA